MVVFAFSDLVYFSPGSVNVEFSSRSHSQRSDRPRLVLPSGFPDEPTVDRPQL